MVMIENILSAMKIGNVKLGYTSLVSGKKKEVQELYKAISGFYNTQVVIILLSGILRTRSGNPYSVTLSIDGLTKAQKKGVNNWIVGEKCGYTFSG